MTNHPLPPPSNVYKAKVNVGDLIDVLIPEKPVIRAAKTLVVMKTYERYLGRGAPEFYVPANNESDYVGPYFDAPSCMKDGEAFNTVSSVAVARIATFRVCPRNEYGEIVLERVGSEGT